MERAEKAKVTSIGYMVQCKLVHFYKARKYKKDVDGCFFFGTRNCFIFLFQKEMFLLNFMRKNDESPFSFT